MQEGAEEAEEEVGLNRRSSTRVCVCYFLFQSPAERLVRRGQFLSGDVHAGASPVGVYQSSVVVRVLGPQTDMQQSVEALVKVLESYRGRDKVVSTRVVNNKTSSVDHE